VSANGEVRVAETWAANSAFSVLGSTLAALGGLVLGSHGLVTLAPPCYLLAWVLVRAGHPSSLTPAEAV